MIHSCVMNQNGMPYFTIIFINIFSWRKHIVFLFTFHHHNIAIKLLFFHPNLFLSTAMSKLFSSKVGNWSYFSGRWSVISGNRWATDLGSLRSFSELHRIVSTITLSSNYILRSIWTTFNQSLRMRDPGLIQENSMLWTYSKVQALYRSV